MSLEHLTPHQLLERVENRNRQFKIASVIFGAVLTAGLAILLVIGLTTLQGVNNQLAHQKKLLTSQQQILSQIQKSSEQRTTQLTDLQNHIDCIVELFQQPNRSQLQITDLESCQLSNFTNPSNSTNSSGASAPAQSAPTKTSTPSAGASSKTTPPVKTPSTPVSKGSALDRVPGLGRIFRALGL